MGGVLSFAPLTSAKSASNMIAKNNKRNRVRTIIETVLLLILLPLVQAELEVPYMNCETVFYFD
jgi:hypothetical protein